MLRIDEKLIRKGKAYGLPYQGSKRRIAKTLVALIKTNFKESLPIYDLFGGGGSVFMECLYQGLDCFYNDVDELTCETLKLVLTMNKDKIAKIPVSREKFLEIKGKDKLTRVDNLRLIINSFGNNKTDYVYSKDVSGTKYYLVKSILENNPLEEALNYRKTKEYKEKESLLDNVWLQQTQVLQRLAQIEQIERLKQVSFCNNLNYTCERILNKSYKDYSDLKGCILYCDPPYENTNQQGYTGVFNSKEFYDWCVEMAKNNIVLVSSYKINDPRFELAFVFDNVRSNMQANGKQTKDTTEKIYIVGGNQ